MLYCIVQYLFIASHSHDTCSCSGANTSASPIWGCHSVSGLLEVGGTVADRLFVPYATASDPSATIFADPGQGRFVPAAQARVGLIACDGNAATADVAKDAFGAGARGRGVSNRA